MNINSIDSSLKSLSSLPEIGLNKGAGGASKASDSSDSFGSTIKSAIDSLNRTQIGAEHEVARAVAGESPDLHQTIAALQAADLSFQFALQVRNKVIGAYEEIMRMQV